MKSISRPKHCVAPFSLHFAVHSVLTTRLCLSLSRTFARHRVIQPPCLSRSTNKTRNLLVLRFFALSTAKPLALQIFLRAFILRALDFRDVRISACYSRPATSSRTCIFALQNIRHESRAFRLCTAHLCSSLLLSPSFEHQPPHCPIFMPSFRMALARPHPSDFVSTLYPSLSQGGPLPTESARPHLCCLR